MGFLRRLFGGGEKEYVDTQGIYLYVLCDNCRASVRLRADKQHDLNRENGGFVWHKTIIDSRCFRPIRTVVHFDADYNVANYEMEGGRFITQEEYEADQAGNSEQSTADSEQ